MDPSYWVTDEPKEKSRKGATVSKEGAKKLQAREEKKSSTRLETKSVGREENKTLATEEKKTLTGKEGKNTFAKAETKSPERVQLQVENKVTVKEERKAAVKVLDASYWVSGDSDTTNSTQPTVAKKLISESVNDTVDRADLPESAPPKAVDSNSDTVTSIIQKTSAVITPKGATHSKSRTNEVYNIVKMERDNQMSGPSLDENQLKTFEKYRNSYESDHEWNLRKAFIVAHHNQLPENQLICLANCFINSDIYGATYPPAVMKRLCILKEDLGGIVVELEERNRAMQQAKEVKFVKASDSEHTEKCSGSDHGHPSHHHFHHSLQHSPHHHHHSSHSDHKYSSSESSSSAHNQKHEHAESEKLGSFEQALLSGSNPLKRKRTMSASDHDSKPKVMTFLKSDAAYSSTDNVNQPSASLGAPPEHSSGYKAAMKNFETAVGKHVQPHGEMDVKYAGLRIKILEMIEQKVKRNNSIEFIQYCLDKVKMVPMTLFVPVVGGQHCELQIDSIVVATGEGTKKKIAKHNAWDNALEKLKKPYFQIVSINPEKKELQASDTPFGNVPEVIAAETPAVLTKCGLEEVATRGMKRLHPDMNVLQNFIIIEPMKPKFNTITALATVSCSAAFSKMKLVFDHREHNGEHWCRVLLEHEVLSDMPGPTSKDAKNAAAEKALEKLRQYCYTIKTKKNEDTEESALSREEVLGEIAKSEEKIDSGIGNKLLKMMGWSGGGIGKKGTGIEEPVKADAGVINRQGLGLSKEQGITQSFIKCVRDVISDYAKSGRQDDMKFSPSFSNEERAVIHKECRKYGLKTRSHGRRNDDRYLVVSRKRTANELISHIMDSGGSTSKYELIPPGSHQPDMDPDETW